MKTLLIAFVLIAVAAITILALLAKKKAAAGTDERWPFSKKTPLSAPEQALFHRLVTVLPEHVVLAQVALSRILTVEKRKDWRSWLNRVDRKSVDFLICRKDFSIVAAIELDDSSHDREDRRKADADKNRALAAAEIELIRWHVSKLPDLETIKLAFTTQSPVIDTPT